MKKCVICNKEFKTAKNLFQHTNKMHKLTQKQYYDTYLKKPDEGKCVICGKPTKFVSYNKGYKKHCSAKCLELRNKS